MTTAVLSHHDVHHRYRRVAATARPVQLTPRGRLVLLVAALLVAFVAFTALGAPALSTSATHHSTDHSVIVRPGQTLWDIAARVAPDLDPRVVIADIVSLNSLADAGTLHVGQPLELPRY